MASKRENETEDERAARKAVTRARDEADRIGHGAAWAVVKAERKAKKKVKKARKKLERALAIAAEPIAVDEALAAFMESQRMGSPRN